MIMRFRLAAGLCLAGAVHGLAIAQGLEPSFDSSGGTLVLPTVSVGQNVYKDVRLRDRGGLVFELQSATLDPGLKTALANYDAATGQLRIPFVRVGDSTYVDVQLQDSGHFVFTLTTATLQDRYFVEVAGASPELAPLIRTVGKGTGILSTNVVPARLDRSGRRGLVFQFYALENFGITTDAPTPDRVVAFMQRSDGSFFDATQQLFGAGEVRLGAAARKYRRADFNLDGLDDWAYTLNREDGRAGDQTSQVVAQPAVVTSKPDGTYSIVRLGSPTWGHSVGLVERASGPPDVVWAGYHGQPESFGYRAGTWQPQPTDPRVTANTFVFLPRRGSGVVSDRWVGEPENYSIGLNVLSAAGVWSEVSRISLGPVVTMPGINYNGDAAQVNVLSYRGKNYTFGGFQESCAFQPAPSMDPWVLLWFGAAEIPSLAGPINQNGLTGVGELVAVSMAGNRLKLETLAIDNPASVENANFFDCRDLNGDGYDDVAIYPYRSGGKPVVYLNDQRGSLRKVGDAKFPAAPAQWGNSATTLLEDMDGDGILDLVMWPGNGINGQTSTSVRFRFYKGTRKLD